MPTELSAHDLAELHSYAANDSALVMSRDWDALAAEYAPDAVRMPPNQPSIQGREEIRRWLEQLPPINSFNFRLQDLRGNGDLAFMRGVYSTTVARLDGTTVDDCGKTLLAFQKQPNGSWLCVSDIWNSDLPLPR